MNYNDIFEIAHHLAQGTIQGEWYPYGLNRQDEVQEYFRQYFGYDDDISTSSSDKHIWESKITEDIERTYEILRVAGFVELNEHEATTNLTKEAFNLLKQQPNDKLFISYHRADSSLLALYLQARFTIAGADAFIDISHIKSGELWEEKIKERLIHSSSMICLISKETLKSINVKNEIQWAHEARIRMIPVFHGEFDKDDEPNKSIIEGNNYLEHLINDRQGHFIKLEGGKENPNAFRNVADEILTGLGYAVL